MHTNSTDSPSVLMVVQSLPPLASGGAEIQALRLAEILIQKGIKVSFISPGVGKIKGYSEINGIPVFRLHSFLNYLLDLLFIIQKNSPPSKTVIEYDDTIKTNNTINRKIGIGARLRYNIFLLNAWFFIRKRKKEFNIIHSHTIEWPAYVSALLSKWIDKKLIVKDSTMNGIFNILRYPSGNRKQELIIRQAHFVAMTRIIENNLKKAGVPSNKISNIPNGIYIEKQYKSDYSGSSKALFVGNLYQQPAKGIDILLKAWKIVIKTIPGAVLEIVGDGDIDTYHQYTHEHGIANSVRLLGKRNNIQEIMLAADIFVLPSRREGMPNVLMEAMMRALPCVATDISGCQDLIDHNVNGLLVPAADITSLAQNIIFMLTNRTMAAKMGANARQTIIQSYNIEDIADKYAALYSL